MILFDRPVERVARLLDKALFLGNSCQKRGWLNVQAETECAEDAVEIQILRSMGLVHLASWHSGRPQGLLDRSQGPTDVCTSSVARDPRHAHRGIACSRHLGWCTCVRLCAFPKLRKPNRRLSGAGPDNQEHGTSAPLRLAVKDEKGEWEINSRNLAG
ncbi:hypothetical protein BJY00DRAFT_126156 [Aspergillus carlsbadensis]|nr:hypothetical protein BJY00DRAFT_126156 [Aspergillus carlsbadensis]